MTGETFSLMKPEESALSRNTDATLALVEQAKRIGHLLDEQQNEARQRHAVWVRYAGLWTAIILGVAVTAVTVLMMSTIMAMPGVTQ